MPQPQFYCRRFLDEAPARSTSAILAIVEEGQGQIVLTDGHSTATFDFFYTTEAERVQSEAKLQRIQELVSEFGEWLRCQKD